MTRTLFIAGAVASATLLPPAEVGGADRGGSARPVTMKVVTVACPSEAVATATRTALRAREQELVGCHAQELAADREPTTRVHLSWTLRGNGSVATPKAEFPDARYDDAGFAFLACLTGRVEGWTFPRPTSGGVPVEIRLAFAAGAPPPSAPPRPREASIDKEAVRKVVQAHAAEIQTCYDRELKLDPRLEGKVTLRWTVQEDGTVTDAAVEDASTTLRNRSVEACMLARLGRWTFAKPKGGGTATITNSWTFERTETVVR